MSVLSVLLPCGVGGVGGVFGVRSTSGAPPRYRAEATGVTLTRPELFVEQLNRKAPEGMETTPTWVKTR
ncbi:hypothetical protein OG317_19835 [Streptomyces sp. NBC_01167]|uniref:hypothetical protein n=1 Tax=Streptomyces sp. NBC_01167 TaxID=2903756 RepID=UPI00386E8882|nr:hypothetical protein OG317_19835 [Streptomyces sp. NBC_01167]